MAKNVYTIKANASFRYERDEWGSHYLDIYANWTSPLTDKDHITSKQILAGPSGSEETFYKESEPIMNDVAGLKKKLANEFAAILREELKTLPPVEETEQEKFEERLKTTFAFDIYIDLSLTEQTGVQ